MGEILFGLIMTQTFTLGAGLMAEEEGRDGARQLLIATAGCNLALLFIVGHRAARHTMARPWLTGLVFVLAGLVLVVAAIALGG